MTISETIQQDRAQSLEYFERNLKEFKENRRRAEAFASLLEQIPGKVKARMNIRYRSSGSYHYATISPKYKSGFTPNDTMLITAFCAGQSKFDFEKRIDGSDGSWSHVLGRWVGGYTAHYEIIFSETSEIDGCQVVEEEVVEKRKVFRVKC